MRALLPRLLGLASLLLGAGCSSEGNQWLEYFQMLRQSVNGQFRDTGITRSQAAAVSYASLGYRLDGSREAMLVLATDINGDQLWTAGSHVVLLTRGGRVVRSVGLTHDIGATSPQGTAVMPPLSDALRAPYRSIRVIDIPDVGYGIVLSCLTTAKGKQNISIIGTSIATRRIDETCRSASFRWSFTDSYWLDADSGFVWHSVQHLHPSGTTLQIEIFRPPG